MVGKTVMGAALVAAALSISGAASATVTQGMTAVGTPAGAEVQPVVVYRHYYGHPVWRHRYWGGVYRPYAYGGFYPGYYGYPANQWGYGYGWGPGIGIGVFPGFGIGIGF